MYIKREAPKGFRPVCIILETADEVRCVNAIFNEVRTVEIGTRHFSCSNLWIEKMNKVCKVVKQTLSEIVKGIEGDERD